ncbi:MAG: SIS domain-containing protein [Oscillospiraceae bacterium]|nr:SIS domain-containing protein [Oscillospiraceae bacterium]
MDGWEKYFVKSLEIVERVKATQSENIMKAAQLMADCTENGGIIRAFGCGHSHLITEDIFWRSATLANVQTIVESVVSGQAEITKSGKLEQLEGYGQTLFAYHRIARPDVVLCVSNSGNNSVTVDFARAARDSCVPVIAITNVKYSDFLNKRHSLGINLKDVADVVIDNCSEIGDAVVGIDGFDIKVGASSTIPGVFIQSALIVQTVELLVLRGFKPDVYYNGHLEVNDNSTKLHNDALVDKYYYRIRNL